MVAVPQFVEAGFDQDGHLPAAQGDADRLLGAEQARAHGQIDVQATWIDRLASPREYPVIAVTARGRGRR